MKGNKSLIVTVLAYQKKNFSESSSLISISKFIASISGCNMRVVVWNNGPDAITNDLHFDEKVQTRIINDLNNTALSIAYNRVIQEEQGDYYLILDDDSDLSLEYLNEITNKIKSEDLNYLTVPIISVSSRVVSPVIDSKRSALVSGCHRSVGFRAIGSGLLFPSSVVDAFKGKVFEEKLSLYGVDTVFCYDYSSKFDKICVLKSSIEHDVAGVSERSEITDESYIFRGKNVMDAMVFIFINYPLKRYLYSKRIIGTIIKYAWRIKKVDIISELFKSIKKHAAQKKRNNL